MKKILLALTVAFACQAAFAAEPWEADAKKFEADFWSSQCDQKKLTSLFSDHFDYVHDDIGITNGRSGMLDLIRGICAIPGLKIRREEIPGTVHYFPLRDIRSKHGEIYGVIVSGEHEFLESENGAPEAPRSRGHFTHLLTIENGQWVVSQIMDYGNQRL